MKKHCHNLNLLLLVGAPTTLNPALAIPDLVDKVITDVMIVHSGMAML
jgi:cellobiose-specific phosphotransferase system component IIC